MSRRAQRLAPLVAAGSAASLPLTTLNPRQLCITARLKGKTQNESVLRYANRCGRTAVAGGHSKPPSALQGTTVLTANIGAHE
jgi:hypothetical protein